MTVLLMACCRVRTNIIIQIDDDLFLWRKKQKELLTFFRVTQREMPSRYIPTHSHDDVIKWKHFPRNWPFVRKIHRSPVNFPHKGQWRGALMFSLIYVWINDWANNREAGDLRRQHGHYDVIVMLWNHQLQCNDPSVYTSSQWETASQRNAISHWLGAYTSL